MFLAQSYGRSAYRYMEMLITAAVIYWILSFILEMLQVRLEKIFHGGKTR
jgi:polar amino acid transport system permease protein